MDSLNESKRVGEPMGVAALVRVLSKGPLPAGPEQPQLSTRDPNDATTELFTTAERLYREHFEFVWRNARRLGCSDDWVDDAVHEIFLIATRRLAEFEGRSSALTWLFAITFRVVQRMQRDRARQRKHVARYVQEQQTSVDGGERAAQAAEYLRHLLAQLPEAQRAIVILSELEGFTSAEIAEALGTPQGTIDSRLRAARIALARAIERDRKRDERFGS